MSLQERRVIVILVSTIVITLGYSAFMIQRYPEGDAYSPEVFRFWGAFFLIFIAVLIVARILIYIVFSIVNAIATRDDKPPLIDERDKLIEVKSTQRSLAVFVLGFILAMGSLVVDQPPATMFIIFICSVIVSEIVSDLSQFYFYRRGF
jgi:hypothetical protein